MPETAAADCSSGAATAEDFFGAAFFEVKLSWKGSMCNGFHSVVFPRQEMDWICIDPRLVLLGENLEL